MELQDILTCHAASVKLERYVDELVTVRWLQEHGNKKEMAKEWLAIMKSKTSAEFKEQEMAQQSLRLRKEGNEIFKSRATSKEPDLSGAISLYTQAIFAAPPGVTQSLAHANRGMALQEFGYFQQAYDDCECALAQDYPQHLRHKILARQAFCAMQLGDLDRLQQHLDALDQMPMNDNFTQQKQELRMRLNDMQKSKVCSGEKSKKSVNVDAHRKSQAVLDSHSSIGRCMVATEQILENELIFTERANAFVPVDNQTICQQCGACLIIPFPCSQCHNQVVYCSRRCARAHHPIHMFECSAYQRKLFNYIGISHLAMRVMLEGLPQVAPFLHAKRNAAELWEELVGNGVVAQNMSLNYIASLRMVTHLKRMSLPDIIDFAVIAELLVVYLKDCTEFLNFISSESVASHADWELLIAALILRHIGQLIVNGHTSIAIGTVRSNQGSFQLDSGLLASDIWQRPFRLRRGRLHYFSHYGEVAAANFPYLSLCNHACCQSFQPKYSGRYVSTFATKTIENGEEIFNCYTIDHRKSKKAQRGAKLSNIYRFNCACVKCNREQPDEDYEKFHRYRCESPACRAVYVPQLPELPTLNWWDPVAGLPAGEYIKCSFCGSVQHCEWLDKFHNLLQCTHNEKVRQLLYKLFDALDNWLVDYNELKLYLAQQLISDCFAAYQKVAWLADVDFEQIGKILDFYLRGIALQSRINSVEYVTKMTYLWDLIALEKYKCTKKRAGEMLKALDIASDEMKSVFMNYYEDYIAPVLL